MKNTLYESRKQLTSILRRTQLILIAAVIDIIVPITGPCDKAALHCFKAVVRDFAYFFLRIYNEILSGQ
jgi:hypothetical protein